MPLTLYLVRHGERIDHVDPHWIARSSFKESCDPPLSKHGIQQAVKTGERIAKENSHIITILSSPFLRCLQTGEEIRKAVAMSNISPLPLHTHPALAEWMTPAYFNCQPQLQNRSHTFPCTPFQHSISSPPSAISASIKEHPSLPSFPESEHRMKQRFAGFLRDLEMAAVQEASRNVAAVVVTHGAGVSAMLDYVCEGMGSQRVGYCSIAKIVWDGTWEVAEDCSAKHLPGSVIQEDWRLSLDDDVDMGEQGQYVSPMAPASIHSPVPINRSSTSAFPSPSYNQDYIPELVSSPSSSSCSPSPVASPSPLAFPPDNYSIRNQAAHKRSQSSPFALPSTLECVAKDGEGRGLSISAEALQRGAYPADGKVKSWAYAKAFQSAFRGTTFPGTKERGWS